MPKSLRHQFACAVALASSGISLALAAPTSGAFFSYSVPQGWYVESDKDGVTATPTKNQLDKSVSVQSCDRSIRTDCPGTCDQSKLQRTFFFTTGHPTAVAQARQRPDGYLELRESGNLYEPPNWISAVVLCGKAGVVFIASTSVASREDADFLVESVLNTITWQAPARPVTRK